MIVKQLLTWWRGEEEVTHMHARCLHCQQKIRFRIEKAGTMSLCPRCRRSVKLPTEEVSLKPLSSAKVGKRVAQRTVRN